MSQDENPIRYFDNRLQKEAVKLLPGQYYATASDKALVTILGSCVAACIFDQEKKIGQEDSLERTLSLQVILFYPYFSLKEKIKGRRLSQ